MIGNNRHSDRTFVSEHICGRLAPSAEPADARFLSRVLPRHPRALSFSLALSRSLSVSGSASLSRAPSSLFHPRPAHSLAPDHPLSLSRRSSRARRPTLLASLSSLVRIVRRVLRSSRLVVSLSEPLFPARYVTTLSRLARSSSNRPRQPSPTAYIFTFFSLALSTPFPRRSAVVSVRLVATLYFCITPSRVLPPVPPRLFRSQAFSFSDQQALSPVAYTLLGVWYAGRTSCEGARVCAREHAPRPSLSRPFCVGGRVCADRFDTRSRKKKWADVSSALVTAACKYGGCAHAPRVHWVSGGTSPASFYFLFCIGSAFRIYSRVIRFAAGYNARRASDGCGS